MIHPAERLLRVNKAWFADGERVVKDRVPGAFKRLVNIVPNLSDGIGQVRTGYEIFNSSKGGIDFNSGGWVTEIPFVHPVQSPTDYDVFLLCQINTGVKRVAMYPHWIDDGTSTPVAGVVPLNETIVTGESTDDDFTLNADQKKIDYDATNLTGAGLVQTSDYYNGWLVYNVTQDNYATVRDYAVAAGAAVVTFVEDVHGATSLGWLAGDTLLWVRNFHDNPYHATYFASGFNPTYNDDKANPPTSNVENSIIRFSGGCGSTTGLRGIHITPKLTRTFFPSHARTFTLNRTYASERECKILNAATTLVTGGPVSTESGGGNTENLTPASASGDVGSFAVTGASFMAAIADGAVPDDTDYVDITVGPTNKYLQLHLPVPTEEVDPSGYAVISINYRATEDVAGTGEMEFGLWDASGEKLSYTVSTTSTIAGWTQVQLYVPTLGLDLNTLAVHMRFQAIAGGTYTWYVSNVNVVIDTMTTRDYLLADKTYWIGVAPIYDGFQIGKPYPIETLADYSNTSGSWSNNYLTTAPGILKVNFLVNLALLNKRITGFAIYCAVDSGQTTVRSAAYQFVKAISITEVDAFASGWTYNGTGGTFQQSVMISQNDIDTIGNTFVTDAGYAHNTPDTMYPYSIESIISGRRLMSNVYIVSNSTIDRANIFTNPVGANPGINSGVLQPDIFSNEEVLYRLRINPLIGTKINAIIPAGIDEFYVIKDRGVISGRIVIPTDTPDVIQEVLSQDIGAATVNGYTRDDDGNIVFPGYDDIFSLKGGTITPLVERPDKNDWLYTYQQFLTSAQKEASMIFWLPEIKSIMVFFGNTKGGTDYSRLQYLFHRGLWSEISLNDDTDFNGSPNMSMRWATQLRNGHVLCTSTESTPVLYRMTWKYSSGSWPTAIFGAFMYTDNGVGIVPYIDTGDLLMGEESSDIALRKVVVNRTLLSETLAGRLDVTIYNEDGAGYAKTALPATDERLTHRFSPTTIRKGQSWRMLYNMKADGGRERITAGTYQINSIEYFGVRLPRVRSTGK